MKTSRLAARIMAVPDIERQQDWFARGESALLLLFGVTLFLSSILLFLIQPMFAKMVLPLLGGTPAVWNTCMVFFQAALLAGYAYAHAVPNWLGVRRQTILHFALLLAPLLLLPVAIGKGWSPSPDANPIPWLLALLAYSVGVPFFVVSTTSPLLQRWFVATGHVAGRDPYFLYSASNLGSMLALLGYPMLVEPAFTLATQQRIWALGYLALVVSTVCCAAAVWWAPVNQVAEASAPKNSKNDVPAEAAWPVGSVALLRLRWIALAFVPSSLMLSVTTYLTTDIAAIPLLWVIPLAVYLLSFILVFARKPLLPHSIMTRILPLAVLLITIVMLSQATDPVWVLLPLHLLTFFIVAMACHGELARLRPPPQHLTEFYLWLSLGGVLGGLFNALIAPLVFSGLAEYPLVLVAACLLRPADPAEPAEDQPRPVPEARGRRSKPSPQPTEKIMATAVPRSSARADFARRALRAGAIAFAPAVVCVAIILASRLAGWDQGLAESWQNRLSVGLAFGLPAILCYMLLHRPVVFGMSIGGLFLAGSLYHGVYGQTVYQQRSFFGIHRVCVDASRTRHRLVHGNTDHGLQNLDPRLAGEPLLYYYRTGPIGQVFTLFSGKAAKPQVAVVGLGAGSLAAYGEAGQHFTYFEIDPMVVHIARDSGYFTFLSKSKADVAVELGDARLTLQNASDGLYGILVIDAFSSDAIPLHLLTREALALYKRKLAPDGILAFNISNRYLDLAPVLGALARDAELHCWLQEDRDLTPEEKAAGKGPSQWVIMAAHELDLGGVLRSGRWQPIKVPAQAHVWTDDFSNILSVFRWD